MKSFTNSYINRPVSQSLIQTIRLIGEYRGKETLYKAQSSQTLKTLTNVAIIQSAESSNRIEGIVVGDKARLNALLSKKSKPKNRPEQEVVGYRDVLKTIHGSYKNIPFEPNIVLQLHRDLFKFTTQRGGTWKSTDNKIIEKLPDGTERVRFAPVAAHLTANSMEELHSSYKASIDPPDPVEPLLAIASYVLDFLCIHPFLDGNGRIARLLSLLMLYQNGYEVGRFISLEKIVEDTKESYYDSLYKSSQGWHEQKHKLEPWWEYFLGVMLLSSYRELEKRVGLVETSRGAKSAIVLSAIERLPIEFTISELVDNCPTVGIDHIRKILRSERDGKRLKCIGRGPDAKWKKQIKR